MLINHNSAMWRYCNQTVRKIGLDQTGMIEYRFNLQGFRASYAFDFVPDYAFFGCSLVFGVGVPEEKIFPYLFRRSHNYGQAGSYTNTDVMKTLLNFIQSNLYSPQVRMIVMWHQRDDDKVPEFYKILRSHTNLTHFFCGQVLPYQRCYQCLPNIDFDVSGTHWGEKTHQIFYETISDMFDSELVDKE
jgi:hypothetical protein